MKNNITEYQQAYAFKIKGRKRRLSCQSGGAFTAIASNLLAKGWVIYGVVYERPYAVYKRAEDYAVLKRMAGSKYVQAKMGNIFQYIAQDLADDRHVLFSGTPCYVSAILNFCRIKKINTQNLLTIDFLCHGVPSPELFKYYLEYTEKRENFMSSDFSFRDKTVIGWGSFYSKFLSGKSGKVTTSWLDIFNSDKYLRDSCYHCIYTSYNRMSDLTISDFWGIRNASKTFGDVNGVSMILVNNAKGQEYMEECRLQGDLLPVPIETIEQRPLHYPVKYQHDDLLIDWGNKSFEENASSIMEHYYKKSISVLGGIPLTFSLGVWKKHLLFYAKGNGIATKCKEIMTKDERKQI